MNNNSKVVVLSGLPGSGKSHHAQELKKAHDAKGGTYTYVVSADHAFHENGDTSKPYVFDPSKLSQAHEQCFRRFCSILQEAQRMDSEVLVIVDNTNLSNFEASPYMLGAGAFGYQAEFVRVLCDPEVAFARQTHGVPYDRLMQMHQRTEVALPWWKVSYINNR